MKKENKNFTDCSSDIADLIESIEKDIKLALGYLLRKFEQSEKN